MTSSPRRRLDATLVDRGHAADLDAARALIAGGVVVVDGAPGLAASRLVARDQVVSIADTPRFVGRGGEKLDGALTSLGLDVTARKALDVGASTGGFTDCLLSRGASRVLAVDVGHGQLHERLLADDRVVSRERTNVRDLTPLEVAEALGGPPGVVTVDVSFTSVVPHAHGLVALAADGADLLVLVKPQFEVDRVTASRGRGVVTDPGEWRGALERCASALEQAGAGIIGAMASPLLGASGNVEFFLHAAASRDEALTALGPLLDGALAKVPSR